MNDVLSKNFFELFGFPLEYSISLAELRNRFREVQKAVHPDKFSADSPQSQRLAVQYAAHANQAFQTLKEPVARGIYLLSLLGHRYSENTTINDSMFLMQQMDFRERIAGANKESLETLLSGVEAEFAALDSQVAEHFRLHADEAHLGQAEMALKKMQFYKRLIEEIEEKM